MNKDKHVVLVAPPGASLLDVAGPLEVFVKASDCLKLEGKEDSGLYIVHVVTTVSSKTIITSRTLTIICEGSVNSINYEVDTLLVTGNAGEKMISKPAMNWLKEHWQNIRRVGSVCAGAFVLAEAGILDGKRATTHWSRCDKMAKMYPKVKVENDPIFVKDGHVYTSAGISTGMDLALALVEEDHGRDLALMVARMLVLYLKRPGNQSQFSAALIHQKVDHQPIREVQDWMLEHLNDDLTVETLAEKASMSPRNFARVFLRETGITPAKYIEKLRLETARRRLEETQLTVDEISTECGLGGADTMRRLFLRHMKTTPTDYRRSFKTALI